MGAISAISILAAFIVMGLLLVVEIVHIVRAIVWYVRYIKLKPTPEITIPSVNAGEATSDITPPTNTNNVPVEITHIPERMFCRKCGKQIPDDSAFCYKCGASVEVAPERSATEAVKTFFAEKNKKIGSESPIEKDEKRVCPNCGKEMPSPLWKLCPNCSEKLPQPKKQPEKAPMTENEMKALYEKAIATLECSSDIDTLREARGKFISLGDYRDSAQKVQECMDKIYLIKKLY